MALDVVAFSEVAARAGTVALQNIAGLADTHVTVLADNIIVPERASKILAVQGHFSSTAASLTNAVQLSSPSLRATSLLDLANWQVHGLAMVAATMFPNNLADNTGGIDVYYLPMNDYKEAPIQLKPGEALQCLSSVDVAAVGESGRVVIYLTDGDIGLPVAAPFNGRIETVFADGQAAAVAAVWSPSAIVFRQALRAGTYALVGAKVASTTGVVARFIMNSTTARPGVPCVNTMAQSNDPMNGAFRYGRLGVWGTFTDTNPPVMEILAAAADAAAVQILALDVIKIA
jgi:hypothetical protein